MQFLFPKHYAQVQQQYYSTTNINNLSSKVSKHFSYKMPSIDSLQYITFKILSKNIIEWGHTAMHP